MLKKIFTFPAGLSYEECLRFFKRYEKKLNAATLEYAYSSFKDEGFYIKECLSCYTFDCIGRLESNTDDITRYVVYNYEEQDRTFIGEL